MVQFKDVVGEKIVSQSRWTEIEVSFTIKILDIQTPKKLLSSS